jgi:hypothetical protein
LPAAGRQGPCHRAQNDGARHGPTNHRIAFHLLPRGPAGNGPNPAVPSIQRTSGITAAGGRLERVTVGRSRRPALVDDEARQPRAFTRCAG